MKKIFFIYLLSFAAMLQATTVQQNTHVTVKLENQTQEKMKLLIGLVSPSDFLQSIAAIVKEDLTCSQQKLSGFNVTLQSFEKVPSKNSLKKLSQEGYNLVVFLQTSKQDTMIEWRLYDTMNCTMSSGKRLPIGVRNDINIAHALADQLWLLLTGQEGIFSTKLAYCVETTQAHHKGTDIYVATPYGNEAQQLIKGGKLLAPRWNHDFQKPLLLFSEVTPSNIRLMSSTLQGQRKMVANFDGLTMLPSFSSDGQKVVYCSSHQGSSQLYYCFIDRETKKRVTRRLTNSGNNTSPTLRDNGDIIFCSDFETKLPQLYYLHAGTGTIERLSQSGYCASPHFCEKNGKVAYCKLINNVMQIFTYDLETKEHKQLTFTPGNKDECHWSPCGNYLAFSVDTAGTSRIALLNIISQEHILVTSEKQRCTYPCWSQKIVS